MSDSPYTITDSRVLSAMSHPARRRLLDVLHVGGPATVSALANGTNMAIGSVSHHLKILNAANLVEEAPERARDRRERWWQVVHSGSSWSSTSFDDDPATLAVVQAANSLNLEHHVSKVRDWHAMSETAADDWSNAAFSTDTWLRMTADELSELSEQLNALLSHWHTRLIPDDAKERELVFVFAHGVPAAP
jgi:DNA-binding transcriptional ArsR family regulator